jgi:hypothetical protein
MSVVNGEFPARGIFFRFNLRRVFAVKFECVCCVCVCVCECVSCDSVCVNQFVASHRFIVEWCWVGGGSDRCEQRGPNNLVF